MQHIVNTHVEIVVERSIFKCNIQKKRSKMITINIYIYIYIYIICYLQE